MSHQDQPPEASASSRALVPQPRQPTSLQGLLRFAMETTKSEDAPGPTQLGPMDEKRKKFLEDAMKSLTIDVIELLLKQINILRNAESLSVDSDTLEYMCAIDVILEHVDNIDTANDFHKIGGFTIFQPCFKCVHANIRAGACDVLAELCQNNPYCQTVVTDNNMIKDLLDIIDKDPNDQARCKAVYAVSCNVRENAIGCKQLIENGGILSIFRSMQIPVDKLRSKCAFLLSCMCYGHPQVKETLTNNDAIPSLISLIATENQSSHEHLLSLLIGLVTENPVGEEQCRDPRYNCRDILRNHLNMVKNREDRVEETQYCRLLLEAVLKDEEPQTDR